MSRYERFRRNFSNFAAKQPLTMEQKFGKNSIDIEALREFCRKEGKVVDYRKGDQMECETDGAWQTVPFPKDFGFASVLTTVAAGDTTTIYGHLAQLRLAPGHYRLCKPIAGKTLSDDFFIRSGIKFPAEIYR